MPRSEITRLAVRAAAVLAAGWLSMAGAAEYRSVGADAAVLFDAPSAKARKLFVIGHGYPLEIVVIVEGWTKVRDANGDVTWIETRQLSDQRTVMVTAPRAQVRQAADDGAPLVFEAQQSVLLELVGVAGAWLQVRHPDGLTGFVKASQVWGA